MRSSRLSVAAMITAIVTIIGLGAATVVISIKVLAAGTSPSPSSTPATPPPATHAGAPNTVTVIGQGTAHATPDTATLTLGANAFRASVQAALDADNADMRNLLAALHAQGVQDQDIQTSAVSVYQQTSGYAPTAVLGYTASNTVTVTIHHLQNVGSVIGAVASAVGNDTSLGGVTLSVASPTSALNAARESAMSDAAARAHQWASLAQRSVGKILSVSEVVSAQTTGSGGMGGAAPLEAGQSKVSVSVTVTYELAS